MAHGKATKGRFGGLELAESLSFLGDHEGVLKTVGGEERSGSRHASVEIEATLAHLAAVAAFRLGRRDEAISRWKYALRRVPLLQVRANLRDVRQIVSLRHGAWAFELARWLPVQSLARLQECIRTLETVSADKQTIARRGRRFLENDPRTAAVLSRLLELGGPDACDLVVRFARLGATSKLYAALYEFGLGQRGSDELRWRALQIVADAGECPIDQVRFWTHGRWTDALLFAFQIGEEPLELHACEFFLSRAKMVHLSLLEGDVERAKQLIGPLLKKRRLHVTHFAALSSAQIHLNLAQGQTEAARSWLAMWETTRPGDPDQDRWRNRIAATPR